jgi:hypothetical protein
MRYWWVNQNQTYQHEVPGGYLWSPKRNQNGARNPFYDFMREVAPGDAVFSFASTLIKAIGIARSYCYEAPKPLEFGAVGAYWDRIGWRVDIAFRELTNPMKPASHMEAIRPRLPAKYAPLRLDGMGKEFYLTCLEPQLAELLIDLIGREARDLVQGAQITEPEKDSPGLGLVEWEEHELRKISSSPDISETDRLAIVTARRGQGLFKQRVREIEPACRITKVTNIEHLRASHCKPWRDSTNEERLDGENGLLLTPSIDHLFDRGFISFEDRGRLLISPVADKASLKKMGVPTEEPIEVGGFSEGQRKYLEFHRESVFLASSFISHA